MLLTSGCNCVWKTLSDMTNVSVSICSVLQAKLLHLGLLNWFLCGRQVIHHKNSWKEGLVPTCRLCLSSLISKMLFCSSKRCRSLSKSSIFCLKNAFINKIFYVCIQTECFDMRSIVYCSVWMPLNIKLYSISCFFFGFEILLFFQQVV